jgi:transmembrane sensor
MSNNNTHMDDDLLVKYLAGETAPAETAQVKDWLSAAEDNRLYFEQFKKIWDGSLDVAGKPRADEDAAFTRLQNRIKSTPPATQPQAVVKPMRRYNWLVAAAVAAVFTAVGYFASNYLGRVTLVNLQSNNSVRIDTLPDGSVVTLNAASKLSYTDKFNGDTRPVTLLGEAFFKITPNKAKPFIINVNGVTVKVVGTSFNVKSRNGKTEVIVETGIVNVSRDKNNIN